MKLVFYSPNFYPIVGGLEGFLEDLVHSLTSMKVDVTVITTTSYEQPDNYPFKLLRNPPLSVMLKEMKNADYFLQFNVSLKGMPAWFLSRKPLVLVHQNVVSVGVRERMKQFIADNFSRLNIGCSEYIAQHYKKPLAIPNAYNETIFQNIKKWEERPKDLLYVGRLVSDKGIDTLLNALYILKKEGIKRHLNIIGMGAEESLLRELTQKLGLESQVKFWGQLPRTELNTIMNNHKILVVPSRYEEPFGIVALEGLAAGCFVIVSEFGGLREAIGDCGFTFPNGKAEALAEQIKKAYNSESERNACFAAVPQHLAQHTRGVIAQRYVNALMSLN